jgi:dihydroorotate dehydrogenase electron transfer subunit
MNKKPHASDTAIRTGGIIFNQEIAPGICRMRISQADVAQTAMPGQFINVRVGNGGEPLWRRPFSIHAAHPQQHWFEILYRVIGIGTKQLASLSAGKQINFVGPLGNSFNVEPSTTDTAIVVGGGLGIAPMVILSQHLVAKNITPVIFYGVRSEPELCSVPELQAYTSDIRFATEDGSVGHKGYITDLVDSFIKTQADLSRMYMFACGPNPMLDKVGQIAAYYRVPCQVSLETLMACGIGACLGCGMKSTLPDTPYVYVCKEGPVFQAGEINFHE